MSDPKNIEVGRVGEEVLEALQRPTGAVQNGPTYRPYRRGARKHKDLNGKLLIKRGAIKRWECETCLTTGKGLEDLLIHAGKTMHPEYKPLDKIDVNVVAD